MLRLLNLGYLNNAATNPTGLTAEQAEEYKSEGIAKWLLKN